MLHAPTLWPLRTLPCSGEPLSFCHLVQQIGVTIQRGNTAAVLGTAPGPWPGVEI